MDPVKPLGSATQSLEEARSHLRAAAEQSNDRDVMLRINALRELAESCLRGARALREQLVTHVPVPRMVVVPPPVLSMTDAELDALQDEIGEVVNDHLVRKYVNGEGADHGA
jgi:hypothetical protein